MFLKISRFIIGLAVLVVLCFCSACNGSERYPQKAINHIDRGIEYGDKGQYDLAIAEFDKAIEIEPNFSAAYVNRGFIYNAKGQYNLAIIDYSKAIELEPMSPAAYIQRGNTYSKIGQHDLAIADYSKAIEMEPQSASISYLHRGLVYKAKGQYGLAITEFNKAIELDQHSPFTYLQRGDTYKEIGQYDLAIADYSKVIELDQPVLIGLVNAKKIPSQSLRERLTKAYFNKGTILKKLEKNKEAIECFNNAIFFAKPDDKLIEKAKEELITLGGTS